MAIVFRATGGGGKGSINRRSRFESVRRVGSRASHGECSGAEEARQKADICLSVALKAANHRHGMYGSDCSSIGVALHGDGLLRGQSGWPSDASVLTSPEGQW